MATFIALLRGINVSGHRPVKMGRLYLHRPKSYGLTKFSNQNIEKWLSVSATTRNWKTVNELYRLATQ